MTLLQRLTPAALCLLLAAESRAADPERLEQSPLVNDLSTELNAEEAALAARLDQPLSLQDCIDLALQRNFDLVLARQARDAARLQIGIAYGEFHPELQLSANGLRREDVTGVERRKDADAMIVQRTPLGTAIEAGVRFEDANGDGRPTTGIPTVALVQPLLRQGGWGRNTSAVRDANLVAEIADTALRAETLRIGFLVEIAYFEILRRAQLIEVNERAVIRDEELLAFSKAKLEAQLATQRDVLSAEIILAQDRSRLVNAQAQYQASLDDMTDILGLRIGRPFQIEPTELDIPATPVEEESSLTKALRDNPLVQRARLDLERADLAHRVAGNERLPQLDLRAAYSQRREPLGSSDALERAWEGGAVLTYPIFNKVRGNDYTRAGLEFEQSRRIALQTERRTTLNVRSAVRNLQRSQDRIAILRKNIEGAQAKVEFAKVNFQLGRASNLDITDAQKDLLDAETDFVNELVNYRQGLANLEQLLGGTS